MLLTRLLLQNFRSYDSADFTFSPNVTYIVGPNTAGKSNIIEAISMLSRGKSFRAEKDGEIVRIGSDTARVKATVEGEDDEEKTLEVFCAVPGIVSTQFTKRYFNNGLPKRRVDFAGALPTLLFEPSDLDLVSGSPILRREFMDEVLEQADREYRLDLITYTKAIRQRNALLQRTRETGVRVDRQFSYWDEIVIRTGSNITFKREAFINYLNDKKKELFLLHITYDPSVISEERLLKYREAEMGTGVTLVGPHRDDFLLSMKREGEEALTLKSYGSRGQQRLGVLQLKLLQLEYMRDVMNEAPVLLLDDIFSELDSEHIQHILGVVGKQQTIITTTHKEFLEAAAVNNPYTIDLKEYNKEI